MTPGVGVHVPALQKQWRRNLLTTNRAYTSVRNVALTWLLSESHVLTREKKSNCIHGVTANHLPCETYGFLKINLMISDQIRKNDTLSKKAGRRRWPNKMQVWEAGEPSLSTLDRGNPNKNRNFENLLCVSSAEVGCEPSHCGSRRRKIQFCYTGLTTGICQSM